MTLDGRFLELRRGCEALSEALVDLRICVTEDRPLNGDVVLIDVYADAVEDLLGWLNEAAEALLAAERAVHGPLDADGARRGLGRCHEQIARLGERFTAELAACERLADLARLGRSRGGEWRAWAKGVSSAVDGCRGPLAGLNRSLLHCWQELCERAGGTSVAIQNTSIGQELSAAEARAIREVPV